MKNTLAGRIHRNMQAAVLQRESSLAALKQASVLASGRHDSVAEKIVVVERQLRAEPSNQDLIAEHERLMSLKGGLLATAEFAQRTYELETGSPIGKPPERHGIRDHQGKFTMLGSHGHFLGRLLKPTKI